MGQKQSLLSGYHNIKTSKFTKTGFFSNGRVINGIIKCNNGTSYEGVWNNDLFYGTKHTSDNIIYKGEWNKRMFVKGMIIFPNKQIYHHNNQNQLQQIEMNAVI